MEYAEEDLSQILPQRPLTPTEVSDMLSPLLDGLSDLHSMGLVHGRLKPSNVLAVSDQLKLSTDQVTSAGEPVIGRRQVGVYDAPESASGTVSPPADVWSLGSNNCSGADAEGDTRRRRWQKAIRQSPAIYQNRFVG